LLVSSSFIIAALVNARHRKPTHKTYASFQRLIAVVLRLWQTLLGRRQPLGQIKKPTTPFTHCWFVILFIIAPLVNTRHWKANTQTCASFQRLIGIIAVVLRLWKPTHIATPHSCAC